MSADLIDSRPDARCLQQLLDLFWAEVGEPNAPEQALVHQGLHSCPGLIEGRQHIGTGLL